MPADRVYRTEAIVLRQRRLGDADKILVLFTPGRGRVEAVIKGVRRTRSRMAGHVEPLTRVNLLLAKGRNLDIVTQAQATETYSAMRADLDRLSRGLYVAEVLDRLTGEPEENPPLFRLLAETLLRLDRTPEPDAALRYFEMQALDLLGYRPQVDTCASCSRQLEPVSNYFNCLAGGAICTKCLPVDAYGDRLSVNALKYLRVLQRGTFGDVERVRLPEPLAVEVERHVRGLVRTVMEREPRSAQFLDAVRRTQLAAVAEPAPVWQE